MNYMHSSEKIKGLRIHQGYTVEQLAEEANISTKFLYEIEAGRKGFSANVLYKVCAKSTGNRYYNIKSNSRSNV